ncbi:hypothetical protein FV228_00135 [Methylobacterium sp. WL18]|uniref:hypothetical protein n=1 Tax=Methylobacterium sp. WL18 TaxID=2603897 RepID=UPI0011CACE5A|nr:hypothetical protein [Methylobacterium sp. WL18]TXN76597.1 hypothetical protein FV228_00135 [Methylobacterium sp. WL18]
MANRIMTLDLFATLDIVEADVTAVVNAYMANPTSGTVPFGESYRIDPAAAIVDHPFANTLIDQHWASPELRRAAVRAAIMLAQPQRV